MDQGACKQSEAVARYEVQLQQINDTLNVSRTDRADGDQRPDSKTIVREELDALFLDLHVLCSTGIDLRRRQGGKVHLSGTVKARDDRAL